MFVNHEAVGSRGIEVWFVAKGLIGLERMHTWQQFLQGDPLDLLGSASASVFTRCSSGGDWPEVTVRAHNDAAIGPCGRPRVVSAHYGRETGWMSTVTSPNAPAEDSAAPPAVVVSNVRLPSTLDSQFLVSLTAQATQGSGVAVTMHAPFNGAPLCPLPQCTAEDVHAAADRARAAQRVWAETPMDERSAIMLRFHDLVAAHADTIMDLIQAENGKARRDAFLEVGDVLNTARYYARIAKSALKNQARKGLIPGLTAVTEIRHPGGIVAVISPGNYTFILGVAEQVRACL